MAKPGELAEPWRQAAVENLAVVVEQLTLPAAQREPSILERALKLLPGLLSTIPAFAKAWEELEPLMRPHL